MFQFHIVGMPNTLTSPKHFNCEFTLKTFNLCQMMDSLGHKVYHYGVEGSEISDKIPSIKHVSVVSQAELEGFFGKFDTTIPELDWTGQAEYWRLFNSRTAERINLRTKPGDFVCVVAGAMNMGLAQLLGHEVAIVEHGVSHDGTFAPFRIFDSYAHMHKTWGVQGGSDPDGKFYDAVIPACLDANLHPLQTRKDEYYLYSGRLIKRRGLRIAVDTCKKLGIKLKVMGPGCLMANEKGIQCADGELYSGNISYEGNPVGYDRLKLYQDAAATFIPTAYMEPCGIEVVESQMVGTPVITTDFGAFPETVEHGKTGFRCQTLNEFIQAARYAPRLDYNYIRSQAVAKFSTEVVRWKYNTYFQRLRDLWGSGWYAEHTEPDPHWIRGY